MSNLGKEKFIIKHSFELLLNNVNDEMDAF